MANKRLEKVLKSLEDVTLTYGHTSRPFREIGHDQRVRRRWFALFAYFIFMMRGLLLVTKPYSYPDNPMIGFLLGDHLASLGYPLRQMWYGLAFIYSGFSIYTIMIVRMGEAGNEVSFMTDFAMEKWQTWTWITGSDVDELASRLHFLLLIYRIGFCTCVGSCWVVLVMSLALETVEYMDGFRFLCSSFWMIVNVVWAPYTVSLVHFLLYIWLSSQVVIKKLHAAEAHALSSVQQKEALHSVLEISHCLQCLKEAADLTNLYNRTMSQYLQGVFFGLMLSSAAALMILFTGEFVSILVFYVTAVLSLTQVLFIFSIIHTSTGPLRVSSKLIPLVFSALARQPLLPARLRRQGLHVLKQLTDTRRPIGFTCGQHFPMSTQSMAHFSSEVFLYVILLLTIVNQ